MEQQIAAAVEALKRGGVILYPTDTVWGLGCDATNASAIEKLVKLKRSESKMGHIVLMADADMAVRYVNDAPSVAWELMELTTKPLTLILPGGVGIDASLLGDDGSIALRVPDHDFCRQLLRKFRRPIVSTSANFSGEDTPLSFDDIDPQLIAGVDLVVDRRCEGHPTQRASSMIVFEKSGSFRIIRP